MMPSFGALTGTGRAMRKLFVLLEKVAASYIDLLLSGGRLSFLGEVFNVLVRRGLTRDEARTAAERWYTSFSPVETSEALMFAAIGLAAGHAMRVWDALVLAAAAEERCAVLISEDFQDGFVWNGVTVVNPFTTAPNPLIANLLS